jgi:type IX secretion system substrate protein
LLIILLAPLFLITEKIKAADYYWVGGTGNWDDFANHWATTSGGTVFHTSNPSTTDNVIFDANSFPTADDTVYVNVSLIYCNDMDWSNVQNHPTFFSAINPYNFINIFGSLMLSANINWSFQLAYVNFKAASPAKIFKTANLVLANTSFTFDGVGGEWGLLDSLTGSSLPSAYLHYKNGTFNSNGNVIMGFTNIEFFSSSNLTIDFSNSEVNCQNWDVSNGTIQIPINLSNSKISCSAIHHNGTVNNNLFYNEVITGSISGNGNHYKYIRTNSFTGGSNTVDQIIFINTGTLFGGGNNFAKAIYQGSYLTVYGDDTYDTLFLNYPGQLIRLVSGTTTTINDLFIANSTIANAIQFQTNTPGSQATIFKSSGTVCLDNLRVKDINVTGGAAFYAGANSVDLGNNSGWIFSSCPSLPVSDVWPGDANNDLVADNNDVLNVGLAYGETGPVRAGGSNVWSAQPATDWSGYFLSTINKKHADCNGDGLVDNNDTTAILLNYGLTHPPRLADPNSNQSNAPLLYLVANPDTTAEGDTIEVHIFLGTQAIPVDFIYGIAFTINFDTALVDTSYMPFDYTGSWLGTPGIDLLTFEKKLFSQGKVDVALTRTDHLNQAGYGYLGKTGIVIVDNVGAKMSTLTYVTLPLSISNVRALTASEFYLTIATNGENVEIDTLGFTGIGQPELLNQMISIYPNPVKDVLTINSGSAKLNSLEIYNSLGQMMLNEKISSPKINLGTQNFEQGIYLLKLVTDTGLVNRKFSVVRK